LSNFKKKNSSKRSHQVPSGSKKYRRMVNIYFLIHIFLLPNLTKSILNNCHFSNNTKLKKKKKKTLVTTTPLRKGSQSCWVVGAWSIIVINIFSFFLGFQISKSPLVTFKSLIWSNKSSNPSIIIHLNHPSYPLNPIVDLKPPWFIDSRRSNQMHYSKELGDIYNFYCHSIDVVLRYIYIYTYMLYPSRCTNKELWSWVSSKISPCLHPVFGPPFTPYPLFKWYLSVK